VAVQLISTENDLKRLDQLSQLADLKAEGIDGIIKKANEVAGEVEHESVLDAALIRGSDGEHRETTRYVTLISWANPLGHWDCVLSFCKRRLKSRVDALVREIVCRDAPILPWLQPFRRCRKSRLTIAARCGNGSDSNLPTQEWPKIISVLARSACL
jgi:hypothetical protein